VIIFVLSYYLFTIYFDYFRRFILDFATDFYIIHVHCFVDDDFVCYSSREHFLSSLLQSCCLLSLLFCELLSVHQFSHSNNIQGFTKTAI